MWQKKGERGHVLEEVLASMRPEELGEQGADNLASFWIPHGDEKRARFWPAVWTGCADLLFLESGD